MSFSIQLTPEQMAMLQVSEKTADYSSNPIIDSPEEAYEQVKHLGELKQEHFVVLTLDATNRLIKQHTVTIGTLTASLVHPREVFKRAIDDLANSVIIAHNHPSGSLNPSTADLQVTERLQEVGDIVGIMVMDHIIVAGDGWSRI